MLSDVEACLYDYLPLVSYQLLKSLTKSSLIKGGVDHGFGEIIDNFHEGNRNVWDDFSFDPRYRKG